MTASQPGSVGGARAPLDVAVAHAAAWVARRLSCAEPPRVELIAAGRSNLTYRLAAEDGRSWVLRRPPTGRLLPGAHDMWREFRILSALHADGSVPVPPPVAFCEDTSVAGVPFYVMADVPGVVLRAPSDAATLADALRQRVCRAAVEVLARVHAVDLESVGLGDLGPPSGYVQRQLRRWLRHVQEGDESDGEFARQEEALRALAPEDAPHTLVHGDYRFDNLIVDPTDGRVNAVVDWEIGTIGDPLADLASFLISCDQPGDARHALGVAGVTAAGGFFDRASMGALYFARTDRRGDEAASWMEYYFAFAYWKLACILHGVASRYRAGAGGGAQTPPAGRAHVDWLLARSVDHLSTYQRSRRRAGR